MSKVKKATVVKAISMGLAVAIAAGVILNPVSGNKAKASEEDMNEVIEVICDELEESEDLELQEDYLNIARHEMTEEMEANIENLENMTEEEFEMVFGTEQYNQNFAEKYEETGKRGVDDVVLKALKKLIKKEGKEGIKKLIKKVAKKLPGFVVDILKKVLGKEWVDKIVGILVMVTGIEDGLVDFIVEHTGADRTVVQVLVEVISWLI